MFANYKTRDIADCIETIKATIPILQERAQELTQYFYERMFKHNPEVIPLFSPVNQATGMQQKTLAAVICSYAENIDNLDALGETIELIANKHASLRIKPEHYPIVGENLLESMKEVLGDVANDHIIDAWRRAYLLLADILIDREKQIYAEQRKTSGGWTDFKKFKVVRKVQESDVITSFYLQPKDRLRLPNFKPGQYITIRFPSPCGNTTMRNYSLSDKPGQEHYRISVKREGGINCPIGYVSNMLYSQVEEGHDIEVAPPCGNFFFDVKENQKLPLVLLAAGVGITPILSILLSSLEETPDRNIILIQASLHENNQAFRSKIDKLSEKYSNFTRHYCYSEEAPEGIVRRAKDHISGGFIDTKLLESVVGTPNADFYFCGPKQFMINLYHSLLSYGTPLNQLHFEFFGPKQEIEDLTKEHLYVVA